jgi:hypothetical protein
MCLPAPVNLMTVYPLRHERRLSVALSFRRPRRLHARVPGPHGFHGGEGLVPRRRSVGAKIMKHLTKLGDAMQMLSTRFTKFNEIVGDLGRVLSKFSSAKQIDLGFDSLAKGTDLKFEELIQRIRNDIPGPSTPGFRSNYQADNAKLLYDTLSNPWGSGNLPTPGMTNVFNSDGLGKGLGDILTGYPITGIKSLLGGTPGAVQDGG